MPPTLATGALVGVPTCGQAISALMGSSHVRNGNSLVGSSHGYKLAAGWEVPMAQQSAAHHMRPASTAQPLNTLRSSL